MTTEAKVGAFTLAGFALLFAVAVLLGGISFGGDKGYTVYAGFRQVTGIVPQSEVMLSGVPIGKVKSIANDGDGVTVTLGINPDVHIPKDSTVTIGSSGVMGEKFVNILPRKNTGEWVSDGDYLIGEDEEGMDAVFAKMGKALEEVQDLLVTINGIVADPQLKNALVNVSVNMADAASHINGLMKTLEHMAADNEGDVRETIRNLNAATAGMQRTMASVESMMANLDSVAGDPTTAENLKITLANIKETSEKIEHIASNLDTTFGDPQTAENLKETIQNARNLTEKADKMLGKAEKIKVQPTADILYSGKESDFKANFNVDVGAEDGPFLSVGVDDIGDGDRVNAQVGKRRGDFAARAGVINGEVGIGLDAYAGSRWKFSADAYDLDDAALRLRAEYALDKEGGTYLLGELNDVTRKENRAAYVGLRQKF